MKYYYDFEFLKGKQDKRFLGIKYGETKPTIDVISVGIVSEDNREYYAISKEFNLKEAWNRYDEKINVNYNTSQEASHYNPMFIKEYWIRENVLKPIYDELFIKWCKDNNSLTGDEFVYFNYTNFKELINKYGKTNKQIAEEVIKFIALSSCSCDRNEKDFKICKKHNIEFYGYYSAYDHVALCWLFGKMIDLPSGFPRITIDLKQEFDRKVIDYCDKQKGLRLRSLEDNLETIENYPNYPKQVDDHNALAEAKWNKELYEFLNNL